MNKQAKQLHQHSHSTTTDRVIQDVVRPAHSFGQPVIVRPEEQRQEEKPVSRTSHRQASVNHVRAHSTEHSRTLMRRAVKKPAPGVRKQLRVQSEVAHRSSQQIITKHGAEYVNEDRLSKAQKVPKHNKVSRFYVAPDVPITFAKVPVRTEPTVQPRPSDDPAEVPPPTPTKTDIFEHAIHNASHYVDLSAHRKHVKKHARHHAYSMAAGVLALLVITGFAAYQNTPGLQLKVAGIRAGISTTTPNFAATGFAYNGTQADQARLVIGLKSGNGHYQLSEQKTNWTGDEMIAHVSSTDASGQANYTTMQAGDNTVYRFNSTQATWVKDGIWYQVNGSQELTADQLNALVQNT